MRRRETGIMGERLAAGYLREHGYEVIETNYRCPEGEIDIVARHGDAIVFVEVRTRRGHEFGTPEESITAIKKERLRLTAARYLEEHADLLGEWRIDVVAIELDSRRNPSRITLIDNAVSDW
jgi:putative endonuclease